MTPIKLVDLVSQYRKFAPAIDAGIQAVLDGGQFIMGPEVKTLEQELSQFTGARHVVGVCDGTKALLIALLALGVGPGDEVIMPTFTFVSPAEMTVLIGAKPVFVDIDPDTYLIDPAAVQSAITARTKAVIAVSLFGQCADFSSINEIAARRGIAVIEDAAQSFGATHHGRRSANLCAIATTSFFPSKPLGCYGDGGACFTSNDDLAKRMREISQHGQSERYIHQVVGINGRLDSIQAAILSAKLPHLSWELHARVAVAARYEKALAGIVKVPRTSPGNSHVYAQYTIEVSNRARFRQVLESLCVPTAVHYPVPLHRQPAYCKDFEPGAFPIAEQAATRVVSLPLHPYLEEGVQERVIAAVKEAAQEC